MEHQDPAEYSDESECDCYRSSRSKSLSSGSSSEEECECMRDYLQSEETVETCCSQIPLVLSVGEASVVEAVVDEDIPPIVAENAQVSPPSEALSDSQQPVEMAQAEQVVEELLAVDQALETVDETPAEAQTEALMEESKVEEAPVEAQTEEKVEIQPEVEQVEQEAVQEEVVMDEKPSQVEAVVMDKEEEQQVSVVEESVQSVPLAVEPDTVVEEKDVDEENVEVPIEPEQTPLADPVENAVDAFENEPEEQQVPLAVDADELAEIELNDAPLAAEEVQQLAVPLVELEQEAPLAADNEAVAVEEAQQELVVEASEETATETSEMAAVGEESNPVEIAAVPSAEAPNHCIAASPPAPDTVDSEITENFNRTIVKKNRPPRAEPLKHKVELTLRFESDVESGFEVMVVPAEPAHVRGRIAEFERIIATSTVGPANGQQQQQQPVNRVLPLCSTKWSNKKEDVPPAEPETPKVGQAVKLFESFQDCARADARKSEVHSPRCLGGIDSPILSSRRFDLSNAPPAPGKLAGDKSRASGEVVYEPVPEVKNTLRTFETLKRSGNRNKVVRANVRPAYRSKM